MNGCRGSLLASRKPGRVACFVAGVAKDKPFEPEIGDYRLHVGVEENIARFNVAMHVFLVVDVGQPPGYSSCYLEPNFKR